MKNQPLENELTDDELLEFEIQRLTAAVNQFAILMKQKLHDKARMGYRGWNDSSSLPNLRIMIAEHADRGTTQMIDVANLAMMIYWNTWTPGGDNNLGDTLHSHDYHARPETRKGQSEVIRIADQATLRHELKTLCAGRRQKDLAAELGVSPQYLTDLIHGKRQISEQIANKLGYTRKVVFIQKGSDHE